MIEKLAMKVFEVEMSNFFVEQRSTRAAQALAPREG